MKLPYQLGDIIKERYRIINILGEGGTAITYEAEDTKQNRSVAIKVLSLYQSQEWKAIELFEREAKVLENLNHPYIPKYYDYFYLDLESDRHFFIVQELIVGKSLKTLVDQGWHFQEAEVTKIAQQVLEILNYLHSLKPAVIHRDIKPHNLIQTEAGDIYLVDFGAVQDVYRNTVTRGATFVGTIDYMSPEQIRGQTSLQSDLYSLGCTLLFLLTRRSPSELPISRMKLDFRQKLQLSDSFAAWLDKILEPVPEDRFSSASKAINQLKEENLDFSEHLMPIRGSKIELKRSHQTLQIEIPPARVLHNNRYIGFLLLIPALFLSFIVALKFNESVPINSELICIFTAYILVLLFSEIPKNFYSTSIKVEKGIFFICHQIGKFTYKEKKISTRFIRRIQILKEVIRYNSFEIVNYYISVTELLKDYTLIEGIKEYNFGKFLNPKERSWIIEEIASQIESFYPETRLPSKDRQDIWFWRDNRK